MTRVLVTGASGFIGRVLCRDLKRAGVAVTGTTRGNRPFDDDLFDPVEIGEIGPETDWNDALKGVNTVVHLAGRAHGMNERTSSAIARYRRVNVQATKRLAEAAADVGVHRFLFLSTVKVNGEGTSNRPLTEAHAPAPEDPYGISKWEAERAIAEVAARPGMETVILRAPLVYGPGVKGNFLSLLRICNSPFPLPLGAVRNRRSLIYLGNLTDAILTCLTHPEAGGKTFLVRDGEDVSTAELIRRLRKALGRPPRLFPVPPFLLSVAGRLAGRKAVAERLLGSFEVDDGKIRSLLGWAPPFTLEAGLARTAAWFTAEAAGRTGGG